MFDGHRDWRFSDSFDLHTIFAGSGYATAAAPFPITLDHVQSLIAVAVFNVPVRCPSAVTHRFPILGAPLGPIIAGPIAQAALICLVRAGTAFQVILDWWRLLTNGEALLNRKWGP